MHTLFFWNGFCIVMHFYNDLYIFFNACSYIIFYDTSCISLIFRQNERNSIFHHFIDCLIRYTMIRFSGKCTYHVRISYQLEHFVRDT